MEMDGNGRKHIKYIANVTESDKPETKWQQPETDGNV